MNKFPELSTGRLLLRSFRNSDKTVLKELCRDQEIAATTLSIPHPFTLQDAVDWLEKKEMDFKEGNEIAWAVCIRQTGNLSGAVGLRLEPKHNSGELGYWFGKSYWGRGYATEASREVLTFAFEELGLNRVEAHHMIGNEASGRVLEKLGMKYEGMHRQRIKKWDEYKDVKCFAILRSDQSSPDGNG